MGQPAACMIENNRGLSEARASGLVIFRSRDYGPKAATVNVSVSPPSRSFAKMAAHGPHASTADVDNFVGNRARAPTEPRIGAVCDRLLKL